MIPFLSKIVAYALIPKLVHDSYIFCKKKYNEIDLFAEAEPRKKRDCTKWTKYSFDTVVSLRNEWLLYNATNPTNKRSSDNLIAEINTMLNLNKSRRAIANVWEGKIDRKMLRDGHRNEHKK